MTLHKLYNFKNIHASRIKSAYNIQVTSNLITFKMESVNDKEQSYTEVDISIPLNVVKAAQCFKSNTIIGFATLNLNDGVISERDIVNLSQLTKPLRLTNTCSAKIETGAPMAPLQLFIKDITGDFTDWDIICFAPEFDTPEQFELITNIQWDAALNYKQFNQIDLLDTILVSPDTSYSNPDYYKFNVSTEPYIDEVYLEQVYGILDSSRVAIDNTGNGSFRVLKSSVQTGSTIRVKLGFANYTGIANCTLEV
jgi:hypothetical protein